MEGRKAFGDEKEERKKKKCCSGRKKGEELLAHQGITILIHKSKAEHDTKHWRYGGKDVRDSMRT